MAWVEALEGGCGRERVPQPSVAELLEAAASKEEGLSGRHSHHYQTRLEAMEAAAAEAGLGAAGPATLDPRGGRRAAPAVQEEVEQHVENVRERGCEPSRAQPISSSSTLNVGWSFL